MVYNSYKKRVVAQIRDISFNIQGLEQEHDFRDGRWAKRIAADDIDGGVVEQREYLRAEDEDASIEVTSPRYGDLQLYNPSGRLRKYVCVFEQQQLQSTYISSPY